MLIGKLDSLLSLADTQQFKLRVIFGLEGVYMTIGQADIESLDEMKLSPPACPMNPYPESAYARDEHGDYFSLMIAQGELNISCVAGFILVPYRCNCAQTLQPIEPQQEKATPPRKAPAATGKFLLFCFRLL